MHLLHSRASLGRLGDPAPDDATLQRCFQAALRAPDHGLLHPYRFHLVRGEARAALGELLASAYKARTPDATPEMVEQQSKKALRAPLIIVVSALIKDHPKVPPIEQILCAGAAAQNILLALHAQGFAGIWRTGPLAYDERVKAGFGLEPKDALVGFIYAGTAQAEAPSFERPSVGEHLLEWRGPQI